MIEKRAKKIINFDSFQAGKRSGTSSGRSGKQDGQKTLFHSSFEHAQDMLCDKQVLLDLMVKKSEEVMREEKLVPDDFILSDAYLADFLATEINLDRPETGSYVELVFHDVKPNRITAVCIFAVPQEGSEIRLSHQMYRILQYREGNREWEAYDFDRKLWIEGAGDDVFDIDFLVEEHEKFISRQDRGKF